MGIMASTHNMIGSAKREHFFSGYGASAKNRTVERADETDKYIASLWICRKIPRARNWPRPKTHIWRGPLFRPLLYAVVVPDDAKKPRKRDVWSFW